ncbi:MAG TPA: DUF4214 domain-containing protein [Burkholderiaceae bacterium]
MQFNRLRTFLCFGFSVILAACGGDSGNQTANTGEKAAIRQKAAAASYNDTVQELYIAYFGRPADPTGLANFEAILQAINAPSDLPSLSAAYGRNPGFKSLIDSFGNSAESNTLYGGSTTGAFVTAIFKNVLGRAPASAGLSYWTNAIDNQGLSKGNAAASIMAGALTNTTAAGLVDAQTIKNKVSVATSFTAGLSANPGVYAGQTAAATARNMLTQVSSTTVASDFQSTVTTTIADLTATAAAENTATMTLGTTTPTSPYVITGAFNANLSNCFNTDLPGCGFTPAGAACEYKVTSTGARYIAVVGLSWQDAKGNNLSLNLISLNGGQSPFVVGQPIGSTTTTFPNGSANVIFVDSYGESLGVGGFASGTITATAVGPTGMTLSFDNFTAKFTGTTSSQDGTQVLNGTAQFICDPTKSQSL